MKELSQEESFIMNLLLTLLASPWHVGYINYCPISGQSAHKAAALLFLIVDWQDLYYRATKRIKKTRRKAHSWISARVTGVEEGDPRSCYDFKPYFVPVVANNHTDKIFFLVLCLLANHGLRFSVWANNNAKLHPGLFNSLRGDGIWAEAQQRDLREEKTDGKD